MLSYCLFFAAATVLYWSWWWWWWYCSAPAAFEVVFTVSSSFFVVAVVVDDGGDDDAVVVVVVVVVYAAVSAADDDAAVSVFFTAPLFWCCRWWRWRRLWRRWCWIPRWWRRKTTTVRLSFSTEGKTKSHQEQHSWSKIFAGSLSFARSPNSTLESGSCRSLLRKCVQKLFKMTILYLGKAKSYAMTLPAHRSFQLVPLWKLARCDARLRVCVCKPNQYMRQSHSSFTMSLLGGGRSLTIYTDSITRIFFKFFLMCPHFAQNQYFVCCWLGFFSSPTKDRIFLLSVSLTTV